MRAHTTVLVPLRALGVGKSRLAPRLSPAERAALAQAMFEDVIAAVRAVPVDEVVVAAGDESVARLGRSLDLRVHVDRPAVRSLDDAIADTVATLRPPGALLVVA